MGRYSIEYLGERLERYLSKVSRWSAGDIRALGKGDYILVFRSAISRQDWAVFWIAIGVAVANGAELKVRD